MTELAAPANEQRVTWSTKNKVGLVLALVYAVGNLPTVLAPSGGDDAPPFAINLISTVLGAIGLVAGIVALRTGSRAAARLTAGSLIVLTVTAIPAFVVGVPAFVKVLAAVSIVLMVVIVVLMFSPPKR